MLWIKDGRPLDDRQGRLSFSNGNRQVIFRNIRREDSGNYACISQDGRILHLSAVDVVPQDVYSELISHREINENGDPYQSFFAGFVYMTMHFIYHQISLQFLKKNSSSNICLMTCLTPLLILNLKKKVVWLSSI